jgi:hypothetical protein
MKTKVMVWFAALLVCSVAFAMDAPDQPKVRKMVSKTHAVIVKAHDVVKKSGKGKDDLRSAFVHQHAARSAMKKGKLKVAAHLTLKARGFARAALKANADQAAAAADSTDTKEETQAADGATPADAQAEVADSDKATPPADDVAKQDVPAEAPEGQQ